MKFAVVELPSNRKFGFFFSSIFFVIAIYFQYIQNQMIASALFVLSFFFIVTTFFNADLLMPLNKLWMQLGFVLGMIVSPIVMAVIFFGLITPFGIVTRIMGRDELRLGRKKKESYWILCSQNFPQTDFKQQF